MIPVVEDYLSELLAEKMKFIQENPNMVDKILGLSQRRLDSLKEFVARKPMTIRKGYPRTPAELPCICIMLSSEEETQEGLGNASEGGDYTVQSKTDIANVVDTMGGKLALPYVELSTKPIVDIQSVFNRTLGAYIPPEEYAIQDQSSGLVGFYTGMLEHDDELEIEYTYMNTIADEVQVLYEANYRIEVWSKNADLTVELYHLAKWALLTGRDALGKDSDIFNQKLSGQDFQPAPGYFPEFVYRRALTFWCQFASSTPMQDVGFISGVTVKQTVNIDRGDTDV